MNYKEFVDYVKVNSAHIAGEGGRVTINHVIKNNGCEMDGLVIMEKDRNIAPTIYLNSFYDEYKKGEDLSCLIEKIERIYTENRDILAFDANVLKNFDAVKNSIVYKVINYKSNEKLLELVPHKRLLDLAVVFYCLFTSEENQNATALIYNNNLKIWNVELDDVYNAALVNTPALLHSKIKSMTSVLENMNCGADATKDKKKQDKTAGESDDKDYEREYDKDDMYVLTNQIRMNGAACILYENVLYDFAKKLDTDLYILPSSIHEVILLPKQSYFRKRDLIDMVHEVNAEGVAADEVLSDNVYEYNRNDRIITM